MGEKVAPLDGQPLLPPGTRIYAFGDLHGRCDLLDALQAAIARDLDASPADKVTVVGIGDYIDRGDDSRGVLGRLVNGLDFGARLVALKGNHEDVLLKFLDAPRRWGRVWLRLGAAETLRSYGVQVVSASPSAEECVRLRDEFARALPTAHLLFLANLPSHYQAGDYFFAHAGARPGIPLDHQSEKDLLWIRGGFADRDAPFEKVVIHGHSPVTEPDSRSFRLNIDTGAYATGRLTCVALEGSTRRLMDVRQAHLHPTTSPVLIKWPLAR